MTAFHCQGPSCLYADNDSAYIDEGTLCRTHSPLPGVVGLSAQKAKYSYSISGTIGALGSMLFTEMSKLPGTLYDHTGKTMEFMKKEAALGMSKYADKDFRESAKKLIRRIKSPTKVDVDIHFETKDRVENITVRGRRGVRSFRFDFDAVSAKGKSLPKNADPFKPFMDTIADILAAVKQVR